MTEQKELTASEYLEILANELHKPFRKKFLNRRVRAPYKDRTWCMDLVDMSMFAKDNDGYRYMLNIVDIYTRFAFARPLKTKSGKEVFQAFMDIIEKSGRQPEKLYVDEGKEFYNSWFNDFDEKNKIEMYSTYATHHVSIVERFNRTLKSIMFKNFTRLNTHRWIDMLPQLIEEYNSRKHSTIKMTPTKASEHKTNKTIDKYNSGMVNPSEPQPQMFQLGDIVRISRVKPIFEKSYTNNWSLETFTIIGYKTQNEDPSSPIMYYLQDYNGEKIKGAFYPQELQKVDPRIVGVYLVDKILKKRKRPGGVNEVLVSWLGYPPSQQTWEPASNILFSV